MEQINCKERLLKRPGLFGVGRRRLGVKVYEIAKAGGKVKAELVFTRAHNNKMRKSTHFFTQMEVNFCNLLAQGAWRQTASVGSKRDKTVPR